jgi:hypothetical protein
MTYKKKEDLSEVVTRVIEDVQGGGIYPGQYVEMSLKLAGSPLISRGYEWWGE